ncbi:MAG: trypsin-like peptidase domain-containing protein, partial [Pseudomonadales bacterium]|nr:trypsin-like peptidase domain-containing protein [Pseudomonadales bacterium]
MPIFRATSLDGLAAIAGLVVIVLATSFARAEDAGDAQSLFARYHESVYQIRVIDNASNNKSSTGTGFLIDPGGLVATNYHVIASVVDNPEKYRIEVIDRDENVLLASLKNLDIVNDLALVKIDNAPGVPLHLRADASKKGDEVFSIGYPYDLGITVVPGTYNGLAPHSATRRVHFTGSLNPGMSGGPAFSDDGQVIGVNVATAGNQMSFLVPVSSLIE